MMRQIDRMFLSVCDMMRHATDDVSMTAELADAVAYTMSCTLTDSISVTMSHDKLTDFLNRLAVDGELQREVFCLPPYQHAYFFSMQALLVSSTVRTIGATPFDAFPDVHLLDELGVAVALDDCRAVIESLQRGWIGAPITLAPPSMVQYADGWMLAVIDALKGMVHTQWQAELTARAMQAAKDERNRNRVKPARKVVEVSYGSKAVSIVDNRKFEQLTYKEKAKLVQRLFS